MVKYMLKFKAELENLTNLQPQGDVDDPHYTYYIKVKCENCGEVSQKETCVSLDETVPLPNSKRNTHLVQKCKLCGRQGTVTMISGQGCPLTQQASQAGYAAILMVFECSGFEPVEFSFGDGWKAESLEGTAFDGIDLSGGEFADYDEKGDCPVGISCLCAAFDEDK